MIAPAKIIGYQSINDGFHSLSKSLNQSINVVFDTFLSQKYCSSQCQTVAPEIAFFSFVFLSNFSFVFLSKQIFVFLSNFSFVFLSKQIYIQLGGTGLCFFSNDSFTESLTHVHQLTYSRTSAS